MFARLISRMNRFVGMVALSKIHNLICKFYVLSKTELWRPVLSLKTIKYSKLSTSVKKTKRSSKTTAWSMEPSWTHLQLRITITMISLDASRSTTLGTRWSFTASFIAKFRVELTRNKIRWTSSKLLASQTIKRQYPSLLSLLKTNRKNVKSSWMVKSTLFIERWHRAMIVSLRRLTFA